MRSAIVAACLLWAVPAFADDHHTVSWFRAHPHEADAQVAACRDDPGYGRHGPNCWNAAQAQTDRSLDRQIQQAARANAATDPDSLLRSNPQILLARLKLCSQLASAAASKAWNCDHAIVLAKQITGQRP